MRRAVIVLILAAAIVALWWLLRGGAQRDDSRPVAVAEPVAPAAATPPALAPAETKPATRIVPRALVPEPESAETRASRPALASGKARLAIPVFEADGNPAIRRVFDLVTSSGVRTADEIKQEEFWIAMTIGGGVTSSGKIPVEAKTIESGLDDDGCATCDVDANEPGRLRIREAPVGEKRSRFGAHRGIKWLAVIPFEAIPPGETKRLDPITLPAIPVLVSGRVENDLGQPVGGAVVSVGLTIPIKGNNDLYKQTEGLGARAAPDGTFRVESAVEAKGFVAWAHVEGALASSVEAFEPKQTDLVLRVRATGGLKGRIQVAPSLGWTETPGVTLEPESVALTAWTFSGSWSPMPFLDVKKTGNFLCEGIPAGSYRLTVRVSLTTVATFGGIVIEPGKINEDPRFQDLFVGEKLRLAVVRVVDKDDRPVRRATVYWAPADQNGSVNGGNTSHTNEAGESTLPLPEDVLMNIRVEARGSRPWSGERVTLPLFVKLDSGAKISVNLPGSRDWVRPDGLLAYFLCLVPEKDADAARKEGRNPIPDRLHRSQCLTIHPRKEEYVFEGASALRMVAYVVPLKASDGMMTTMIGEDAIFHGEEGLDIGRLELKSSAVNDMVTFHVDTEKLKSLALK